MNPKPSKRAFTLLETMIAFALFSSLITALFWSYNALSLQKKHFEQRKWPLLEERYARQRLESLLPTITTPFFSSEGGCIFAFDRGPHPDPLLSNTVLGRLYYNPMTKQLCLGIWPKWETQRTTPCESYVLLDEVERCGYRFYAPPDPRKVVEPQTVGSLSPRPGWNAKWEAAYRTVPAFIELTIERKGETRTFTLDLDAPIVYAGSAV